MTAADRRTAAREAMLAVAEARDIPVTVRQVDELLSAAETELTRRRPFAPSSWVAAGPTRAALQGLVAGGWPLTYLAQRLDWTTTEVSQRMRRPRVTAATEAQTLALEADLRGVDPLAAGVPELAYRKARNLAVRRGWAGATVEEAA